MRIPPKSPPPLDALPSKTGRQRVGGPPTTTVTLKLKTTTPILGGGTKLRQLDDVDIIRTPTIRGHLRFWWRALFAHEYADHKALYAAEKARFGGMSEHKDKGQGEGLQGESRSFVELQVLKVQSSRETHTDPSMYDKDFYALWTAKSQSNGTLTAPRYESGLSFTLTATFPKTYENELISSLKAWVLLGGYGSRTRRGLGSLSLEGVEGQVITDWLPAVCSIQEIERVLKVSLRESPTCQETPSLCGATWSYNAQGSSDASRSWVIALNWLKDFRQGTPQKSHENTRHARNPGDGKPGRSNWPEPDKLRLLEVGKKHRHQPMLKSSLPCWPRASLGLPIVGKFTGSPEPPPFELIWQDAQGNVKNRLASPLIVKSLQLSNDQFVPLALWLNRAYPEGKVGFKKNKNDEELDRHSRADFDVIRVGGELPRFESLHYGADAPHGERVKQAWLHWLRTHTDAQEAE